MATTSSVAVPGPSVSREDARRVAIDKIKAAAYGLQGAADALRTPPR